MSKTNSAHATRGATSTARKRPPHPLGVLSVAAVLASVATVSCAAEAPLSLDKVMIIPKVPVGPYSDTLSVDAKGGRIFATPQAAKAVAVLDLKDGHVLKMIDGIKKLHAVYYVESSDRIFVADGGTGELKIYDGKTYGLIKSIQLAVGADGIAYDPTSNLLYVGNGGEDAEMDHSLISVVDAGRLEKVTDISIPAAGLEAIVFDPSMQRLYVNLVDNAAVAVVDLTSRKVVDTWKLPGDKYNPFAAAVDPKNHRLYVACRNDLHGMGIEGTFFAIDTNTGRITAEKPIGGWSDGIFVDQKRNRIYITTGIGRVESYGIGGEDKYNRLKDVFTPLIAKHGVYSEDLDRLFVDAPHLADTEAQVISFRPRP